MCVLMARTYKERGSSRASGEGDVAVLVGGVLVAVVVGQRVVAGAERDGVGGVGLPAAGPGCGVVDVAHGWWPVAAFGGAATVLECRGDALGFGVEPGLAAQVEHGGGATEDGGDDPGLAGQPAGLPGRDRLAGVQGGDRVG